MGLSGGARHLGEWKKGRVRGTYGLAVREANGEAMSGKLLVVTRSVRYQKMAGTARVGNCVGVGHIFGNYR